MAESGDSQRKIKQLLPGYHLEKKIGQGGMGAVYQARQESMDRVVAVKVLPKRLAKEARFKERFLREARAAGRLNHVNIVAAYDCGEANGYCYIAMEMVEGGSLGDRIKKEGPLEEAEAIAIAAQMASALSHAWAAGIVHRDVKPENFLYTSDGVAKLCDLGIAKAESEDAALTQDGTAIGTPHFISPEQARGKHDLDTRADIYSLGASLYYLVSGRHPYSGETPAKILLQHIKSDPPKVREVAPKVSAGLEAVIVKAMAKKPEDRYQTPEEMEADLIALESGDTPSVLGRRSGRSSSATRTRISSIRRGANEPAPETIGGLPRNLVLAGGGGAVLLVLVLVAYLVLGGGNGQDSAGGGGVGVDDREVEARHALQLAQDRDGGGNLEAALAAYQRVVENFGETRAGGEARARIAAIEKQLAARADQAARAKRLALATERFQDIQGQRGTAPAQKMVADLEAFLNTFGDTPEAEKAKVMHGNWKQRLERIEARKARLADKEAGRTPNESAPKPVANPASKPPEVVVQKREAYEKELIGKTRDQLRAMTPDQVLPAFHEIKVQGKRLAVVTPDVARVAKAAPQSRLRMEAIPVLESLNPKAALGAARRQLEDRNEAVRLKAIEYLQSRRDHPSKDAMRDLAAKDPSPMVRARAKEAIKAF